MKKVLVIGSILAVLAVTLAVAGYAYAQTPEPGSGVCPNFAAGLCGSAGQGMGPGMMGGRWNNGDGAYGPGQMMGGRGNNGEGNFGPGMMGRRGGQGAGAGSGPMHTYMVEAFAAEFDMTVEELQAELDGGKRIYDVAVEKGYTDEQFTELMTTVRAAALEQAVAAGDVTQEQADWMQQRWENNAGSCPMHTP